VYAYQRSGPAGVGVVGFARLIAPALLLPFLSLLGDRHRRTRVLVLSALSGAVFLAAAAVAVFAGASATVVYVLAVGVMVGASVFRPTQAALLPSLARAPSQGRRFESFTAHARNPCTLRSLSRSEAIPVWSRRDRYASGG
jgi:MFS family permease